jgi:peptidyl-prolyl cis-trans isomerase SurA
MGINSITSAFSFKGPTNETLYRIIQLQSRTVPHKANLQQDYNRIQEATKQSKQNDHLSNWIEEKLSATYLYLDDRYNSCPNLDKWRNDSAASKSRD